MKLVLCTIDNQPLDFKLLAQNMRTYQLCGLTAQEGFEEVPDIPLGYSQRVLPGHYGDYLTMTEITNFELIQSGQMADQLTNLDAVTTELSVIEVERVMEDYKNV